MTHIPMESGHCYFNLQKEEHRSYSLSLQIKKSLGYYSILLNSGCKSFLVVSPQPPCPMLIISTSTSKMCSVYKKTKNPVLPVSGTGSSYASEIHWILSLSDHRLQEFCRINLCLVYIAQYCLQVLLSVCAHNVELHPAYLLSLLCCFWRAKRIKKSSKHLMLLLSPVHLTLSKQSNKSIKK